MTQPTIKTTISSHLTAALDQFYKLKGIDLLTDDEHEELEYRLADLGDRIENLCTGIRKRHMAHRPIGQPTQPIQNIKPTYISKRPTLRVVK